MGIRPLLGLMLGMAPPLQWTAPDPGCPSASRVAAQLAARVQVPADGAPVASARVEPTTGGGWRLYWRATGTDDVRQVEFGTCAAAAEAAVLMTAIAIDPSHVDSSASTDPTPTDPTGDPPAPTDPAVNPGTNPPAPTDPAANPGDTPTATDPIATPGPTPDPAAEPLVPAPHDTPSPTTQPRTADSSTPPDRDSDPPSPRLRVRAQVQGGASFGGLPSVGALLSGEVGLWGRRWFVVGGAHHRVVRRAVLDDDPGAGGRFSRTVGVARGGPVFALGPLEVPLAAGLEAGLTRAVGFGGIAPVVRRDPWLAVSAGAGLAWAPARRLAVTLDGALVVPLLRGTYTLGRPFVVHRTSPVAGRVLAGIQLRFS